MVETLQRRIVLHLSLALWIPLNVQVVIPDGFFSISISIHVFGTQFSAFRCAFVFIAVFFLSWKLLSCMYAACIYMYINSTVSSVLYTKHIINSTVFGYSFEHVKTIFHTGKTFYAACKCFPVISALEKESYWRHYRYDYVVCVRLYLVNIFTLLALCLCILLFA